MNFTDAALNAFRNIVFHRLAQWEELSILEKELNVEIVNSDDLILKFTFMCNPETSQTITREEMASAFTATNTNFFP